MCHGRLVRMVRDAKKQGLAITCETCPHYFTLCDEDIGDYNTNRKMNPPLRTRTTATRSLLRLPTAPST